MYCAKRNEVVYNELFSFPQVDSWALGVLLYTLVYGTMPFDGGDHKNLIRQISNGEYKEPTQSSGTIFISFAFRHARETPLIPVPFIKPYHKLHCLVNLVRLDRR